MKLFHPRHTAALEANFSEGHPLEAIANTAKTPHTEVSAVLATGAPGVPEKHALADPDPFADDSGLFGTSEVEPPAAEQPAADPPVAPSLPVPADLDLLRHFCGAMWKAGRLKDGRSCLIWGVTARGVTVLPEGWRCLIVVDASEVEWPVRGGQAR